MDPTIAYLCRPKPWLPYNSETNHGLCHDLNPVIREDFERREKGWWESLLPGMKSHRRIVSSFTTFMGEDYDRLVYAIHGRLQPKHDGLVDEAGTKILLTPRCGHPDFMLAEMATGRGSWAAGCLGNDGVHEVYVFIDGRRMPSRTRGWWDSELRTVMAAYAAVGWRWVLTEERSKAHIVISWESLSGSIIGLAQLPGSGHCRTGFFLKMDPNWTPSENQNAKLLGHEGGHSANSGHIPNDPVMHPSMGNNVWNGSFAGTAFGSRLNQFFGGEPVPPDGGDDPGPNPPPGDSLRGEITVGGRRYQIIGVPG